MTRECVTFTFQVISGSHLVSLGVGTKRGVIGAVVTEIDLILNRAGLFGTTLEEKQVMTVCPKHRKTLTIDWMGRKINTCCYPNHTGQKKGNLLLRRANAEMSKKYLTNTMLWFRSVQQSVQNVERFITNHALLCIQPMKRNNMGQGASNIDDIPGPTTEPPHADDIQRPITEPPHGPIEVEDDTQTVSSQSSQSTTEQEVSIWVDEIEDQQEQRKALNEAIGSISSGRYSPIMSTLNTSWDDVSRTQQSYYLRKASETIGTVLSVICPGQEDKIWSSLQQGSFSDGDYSKHKHFAQTGLVDVLIKAHDEASTWQTKRQILSLFANDFSRAEMQQMIPRLSKWRIDQARQHAIEAGKGQPISENTIFRTRIDVAKVEHFLDFISRPDMLQDVAFGTKTMKLDSGERIVIPAVIRTLIPSRIIEQYSAYCIQIDFEPASERSLFRMLDCVLCFHANVFARS
ncbi:hypothetical protein QZH41_011154 [Actinostola sp. cb2023]|nr:hypothetical protein QZH41_011154 [Actinostola sp. cb2023]